MKRRLKSRIWPGDQMSKELVQSSRNTELVVQLPQGSALTMSPRNKDKVEY